MVLKSGIWGPQIWITRETLHKWPDTDALFFVSDELAAGAVMECNRRGIKPGKDIDICGFNDLSFASKRLQFFK